MGSSVFPAEGASNISLRATYTSAGTVTIPSGRGFVFAQIGDGTVVHAQGWVPAQTTYTLSGSLYYYSYLVGTGPNLYIWY